MPRQSPAIPNDLLLARFSDRNALSDDLWLLTSQVGMLLGRSQDQLVEDRKCGNPPPSMKPWGEKGTVRYRLGTVRDWMLGPAAEEYANTTAARVGLDKRALIGLGFLTFTDWLDNAQPTDQWPFLLRKGKPPIDFFKSLGMGDDLSDEDECGWLSLKAYLAVRSNPFEEPTEKDSSPILDDHLRSLAFSELADHLNSTSHPDCSSAYALNQSMGLGEVEAIAYAIRGTAK